MLGAAYASKHRRSRHGLHELHVNPTVSARPKVNVDCGESHEWPSMQFVMAAVAQQLSPGNPTAELNLARRRNNSRAGAGRKKAASRCRLNIIARGRWA